MLKPNTDSPPNARVHPETWKCCFLKDFWKSLLPWKLKLCRLSGVQNHCKPFQGSVCWTPSILSDSPVLWGHARLFPAESESSLAEADPYLWVQHTVRAQVQPSQKRSSAFNPRTRSRFWSAQKKHTVGLLSPSSMEQRHIRSAVAVYR